MHGDCGGAAGARPFRLGPVIIIAITGGAVPSL